MWFNKKIKPEKIKAKNTKILHSCGIPVIEHLPFLDQPEFNSSEKIARRMMVLLAIFQLHLEAPNEIIEKWLTENGLLQELNEEEFEYLKSNYSDLPQQSQIDIYWNIEAVWAFAWVGKLHNSLTFNAGVEDSLITLVPSIQKNESAREFISNFRLRGEYEVFEMLDKFYRAHWFARNNKLNGYSSEKVDLDIIMERRKALEYSCYKNCVWNEISLDT